MSDDQKVHDGQESSAWHKDGAVSNTDVWFIGGVRND